MYRDVSGADPQIEVDAEGCYWCGRKWHPVLMQELPDPDESMRVGKFGPCHSLNVAHQLLKHARYAGEQFTPIVRRADQVIADISTALERGALHESANPKEVEDAGRAMARRPPLPLSVAHGLSAPLVSRDGASDGLAVRGNSQEQTDASGIP